MLSQLKPELTDAEIHQAWGSDIAHPVSLEDRIFWPVGVYVAQRRRFEAIVDHPRLSADDVLALAFAYLPLAEHDWIPDRTTVSRGDHPCKWIIARGRA